MIHGVNAVIWCDAEATAAQLHQLLEGAPFDSSWQNSDLWQQLWLQLADIVHGSLRVQFVRFVNFTVG